MPSSADMTKILTCSEMQAVLADLKRKAPRSKNTRLNLVIFRLAACCGLRASEIAQSQMADIRVEMPRPHIRIRVVQESFHCRFKRSESLCDPQSPDAASLTSCRQSNRQFLVSRTPRPTTAAHAATCRLWTRRRQWSQGADLNIRSVGGLCLPSDAHGRQSPQCAGP